MKRNSYFFISLLLSVVLFTSCITEDEYDNSPEGNFEALWQTIDRQYCFLDYKKQEREKEVVQLEGHPKA